MEYQEATGKEVEPEEEPEEEYAPIQPVETNANEERVAELNQTKK